MTQKEFKINVFSLSERIYPMMARMIGKSNVEDAIQEVMIKLWKKRNEIQSHPNLKGLVYVTARNYCLDILRRKPNLLEYESTNLRIVKSKREHKEIEWKELNLIIKEIISKLPEQQKEVFEMRDIDGYETMEVAETLEIKPEHVRVLLSRARKYIAKELEEKYHYKKGAYER